MTGKISEEHIVDIEELKEIMDGDMELIKDCFADFVQDFPNDFHDIKTAVTENDGPKLDASAHKLKGTLRYLAAGAAADAAYALELSGKSNDMKDAGHKLDTLDQECQKLMDFINNFRG